MTDLQARSYGAASARLMNNCSEEILTSSFFMEKRAFALPVPSEVRAINRKSGNTHAENFSRPPPVRIPSLGLLVKYGGDVTVLEARTQMTIRDKLLGQVPIPEVFGWAVGGGQCFIYMQLVEGVTLQDLRYSIDKEDRRAICTELSLMVDCWRSLPQDDHEHYIGSLFMQPLNDIFLKHRPALVGPFEGPDALEQFQNACDLYISQRTPIVFTHGDIVAPSILLSPGLKPRVAAIIDWAQAGWYPSYWEYCKAFRVDADSATFSHEMQEEWRAKYLPSVMDPVDEENVYHPFVWFHLSKGI